MFKRVAALDSIYPPLFSRYVEQEAGVIPFFNGNYLQLENYKRKALLLQERTFPREARELILEHNRRLPVQPTGEWEKKVLDRNTLFVITGQQPGLFAGPLLVLYKGLAAARLARFLEEQLQLPVQALFWVASEDHNVDPLLRTFMPLQDGSMARVHLPVSAGGLPAGMVSFDEETVQDVLEQLFSLEKDFKYGDVVREWLQETARQGDYTLSGWFTQIMNHLCTAAGLIFFDPLQAAARGLYLEPLFRTLECSIQAHEQIARAEKEIAEAGFPLQVRRRGQESLIMVNWENRRYNLLREGDHFFTPGGELSLTRNELLALIVKQPSLFSPGVLMRPLFQDMLYPTLAYVAGPGELAYYAQNMRVYPLFKMEMPILYPRPGVTLLEPVLQALAARHKLDLEKGLSPIPEDLKLLSLNIRPRSSPQERVFSIVPYLIRYGFSFWQDFCYNFPSQTGHYLYLLKEGA